VKLQPDPKQALNTVTRYDSKYIEINDIRFEESVLVLPEGAIEPWQVSKFEDLTREDFAKILVKSPALVIFGSGQKLRFPPPHVLQDLIHAKIGFETMDTQAACRTYNILMSEGRLVLGAFLLEPGLKAF
jgi:uncharacterized protein